MDSTIKVRIDKFLWAIRLYKTRSLAAQACQGGLIKLNGQHVKPAHPIKIGDRLTSSRSGWTKALKVIGLLDVRVPAGRVPEFIDDVTEPEEYQKAREAREAREHREMASVQQSARKKRTQARPTKRDRRQMEEWFRTHTGLE